MDLWFIGRMHNGKRLVRSAPDHTAVAYETREKAEQAITDQKLGDDCFVFSAPTAKLSS